MARSTDEGNSWDSIDNVAMGILSSPVDHVHIYVLLPIILMESRIAIIYLDSLLILTTNIEPSSFLINGSGHTGSRFKFSKVNKSDCPFIWQARWKDVFWWPLGMVILHSSGWRRFT